MPHRGRLNVLTNIARQVLCAGLPRVRGPLRARGVSSRLRRREVPPGRPPAPSPATTVRRPRSPWPPTPRTWRPSTRCWRASSGPSRTCCRRSERFDVLPVLIHGDAAFAGQGIVAETLHLSQLQRLPHRRHRAHRGQQPGGLHDQPRSAALLGLLHGCRARWCRRRSSTSTATTPEAVRPGRSPGLRVPAGLPQGRRDRPGRATAAAATTRPTIRRSPSR
jgi:hypothetical protein